MLPCVGREHYRLSVTDGCRCWGDDEISMRLRAPKWLVNIAHYAKLYTRGNGPGSGKLRPSSGDALDWWADPISLRNPAERNPADMVQIADLPNVRFGRRVQLVSNTLIFNTLIFWSVGHETATSHLLLGGSTV